MTRSEHTESTRSEYTYKKENNRFLEFSLSNYKVLDSLEKRDKAFIDIIDSVFEKGTYNYKKDEIDNLFLRVTDCKPINFCKKLKYIKKYDCIK
jgi:hypothetical protein